MLIIHLDFDLYFVYHFVNESNSILGLDDVYVVPLLFEEA